MRGVWLESRSLSMRDDLPVPAPVPGEALVRVRRAGICNTDLELARGYYPFRGVPGHEFVGVVEQAEGAPQWVGRRVVGEINASCGACAACRAGRRTHCERRTVLGILGRDGAFAEYLALPVANLHAVPDGMPDNVAAFTEPCAAAFNVLAQVEVARTDRVAVIGDGKLGLLVAQAIATRGCDLLAVGRHAEKLALLSARGIATGRAADLAPRSMDVVVECTGNADGLALALAAVRPRGTVVLKSTYHGQATLDMSRVVVEEITLVGSRCGAFEPALAALTDGRVRVDGLLHRVLPLDEALEAFALAEAPGVLKVVLDCA